MVTAMVMVMVTMAMRMRMMMMTMMMMIMMMISFLMMTLLLLLMMIMYRRHNKFPVSTTPVAEDGHANTCPSRAVSKACWKNHPT